MHTHLLRSAQQSFIASALITLSIVSAFFAFEPNVGRSQEVFLVSQTITEEVSFRNVPADVSMAGNIAGLGGGYATGTTIVVVNTNDSQGYTMTLAFSSSTAMNRLNGTAANGFINNYTPATPGTPDFTWQDNTTGQPAEFGYTVRASTTGEVDLSFRNNGSACGVSTGETNDRCWLNPSTTPEVIMLTSGPNTSSTSTIKFKVAVPNAPSPALPSGTYIATGTLTLSLNP